MSDPPEYEGRFDDNYIASADPSDSETFTGEFLGLSYDTEPDTMVLRLRASAEDVKRALPFVGGRGVLRLEERK